MTLFEQSIKSKYTKTNYINNLNQFVEFVGITCVDDLLEMQQTEIQRVLEDYILELRRTKNPNSIPSMFRGIKHFFIMNGIALNWHIIYKMFPQKRKSPSLRAYTTQEIKNILNNTTSLRDQALIHFLASTGARIGVFDHDLVVKHIKKMPSRCYAVMLYAQSVEEYWSFLTPQASKALDLYHDARRKKGEVFTNNTPIFTTRHDSARQLGWSGARSVVYRAVSKINTRSKQDARYDVQVNHGFRKRVNTILKLNGSVNYNIAEKIMGHKNGLDGIYFTPTVDELFREFRKVVPKMKI